MLLVEIIEVYVNHRRNKIVAECVRWGTEKKGPKGTRQKGSTRIVRGISRNIAAFN